MECAHPGALLLSTSTPLAIVGPLLPVQFTRPSSDAFVTMVAGLAAAPAQVLWGPTLPTELRPGKGAAWWCDVITRKAWMSRFRAWQREKAPRFLTLRLRGWVHAHVLDAAVLTTLGVQITGQEVSPPMNQVADCPSAPWPNDSVRTL